MATKSARSINRNPAAWKTEAVLPIRMKMNAGHRPMSVGQSTQELEPDIVGRWPDGRNASVLRKGQGKKLGAVAYCAPAGATSKSPLLFSPFFWSVQAATPSVSSRTAYAQRGTNTLQRIFRDHFGHFAADYDARYSMGGGRPQVRRRSRLRCSWHPARSRWPIGRSACNSSIYRSISICWAPVGVRAMSFGPPW